MRSEITLISENQKLADEVGADLVHDYKIIDTNIAAVESAIDLNELESLLLNFPNTLFVIKSEFSSIDDLKRIINKPNAFAVANNDDSFRNCIYRAIEHQRQEQQQTDLATMISGEAMQLEKTQSELNEMIGEKEQKLKKSKQRLERTTQKVEALQNALVAIHRANSLRDIENTLTTCLAEALDIELVRITIAGQSEQIEANLKRYSKNTVKSLPIQQEEIGENGKIIFIRTKKKKFTKEETDFLLQITDGITLSLDRLAKIEHSEILKQQWESTFDAISDPIALCDNDFNIVRMNKAYQQLSRKSFESLLGKNIFTALFDKELSPQTLRQSSFSLQERIHGEEHSFDVNIQDLGLKLVRFKDLTNRKKLERQILESSKMVELGTIGSSIAHELNNPLGGIISFLQLIKMDLKKEDKIYDDIIEMETAAHKCKEIVESLLSFSRKQSIDNKQEFDLVKALQDAIKLSELQTKYKSINVEFEVEEGHYPYRGNQNLLTQAFRNILQNAIEAIASAQEQSADFDGQIRIVLSQSADRPEVTISDNGSGIESHIISKVFNPLFTTKYHSKNTGLGLTVAFQIVREHGGQLEIFSQPKIGTAAKVSL